MGGSGITEGDKLSDHFSVVTQSRPCLMVGDTACDTGNDILPVPRRDLNLFFNKQSVNMDTNMEQEFDLLVSVYDDKIIVTQATASDWDEGGTIG